MASQFDDTDFIDREFQQSQQGTVTGEAEFGGPMAMERSGSGLPTREELEAKVGDTQNQLSALKRQQEELEHQRAALEETRRRRKEFQDGKSEMVQHLTRGIALMEEAELAVRRDSVQMSKALEGFKECLEKISGCSEESWTADNVEVELTRALTAIENGRMEWNAARLKWAFLDGEGGRTTDPAAADEASPSLVRNLAELPFTDLCRMGLALTWPIAVTGLVLILVLLFRNG